MTTWHKGPPPSTGWWPASVVRNKNALRWWDGKYWSDSADPSYTAGEAAWCAKHKVKILRKHDIKWTERWWEEKK